MFKVIKELKQMQYILGKINKDKFIFEELGLNFSKENISKDLFISFYILQHRHNIQNNLIDNNILFNWSYIHSIYISTKNRFLNENETNIDFVMNSILLKFKDKTVEQIFNSQNKFKKELNTILTKEEFKNLEIILLEVFNKLDIIAFNYKDEFKKELLNFNLIETFKHTKEFYNLINKDKEKKTLNLLNEKLIINLNIDDFYKLIENKKLKINNIDLVI